MTDGKGTGLGKGDPGPCFLLAAGIPTRCSRLARGGQTHAGTLGRSVPRLSLCQVHPRSVPAAWGLVRGQGHHLLLNQGANQEVSDGGCTSTHVPSALEPRSPGPAPSLWEPFRSTAF